MKHLRTIVSMAMLGLVLGACTGSEAIDLNKDGQVQPSSRTASTAPVTGSIAPGPDAAAAVAAARVHFAAAVGTPAEALTPLQEGLNQRARERGLNIETADNATLVVNGYFSTVAEDGGTLIIYVWDVSDKAGNRVHRLQGQQKVSNTSGGWEAVDPAIIKRIGEQTIDELAGWLSRSSA